jgi:hypothetical protein
LYFIINYFILYRLESLDENQGLTLNRGPFAS